jgi:allantoinase
MATGEFIISSRNVVTRNGVRHACVHVRDGKIKRILEPGKLPSGIPVEDAGDLVVMPGLVDTHVHINEPGRTQWEGFETATKAAAAGGITTLVDMPLNSSPVTTTVEALQHKLDAAQGKLWVDCGFYGGVIPGHNDCIQPLLEQGVLGFKAFLIHSGIDEFPNVNETDLRAAMPMLASHNVPLLVHCELSPPNPQSTIRNPKSYSHYLASRPSHWEHDAVNLMIGLCRDYGCKVHVVHVSSSDTIPLIREARRAGLPVSAESCPHYLYFVAEDIADGDTRFKCAPPIRDRENREGLWNALRNQELDFIVSDHSPSTPVLKFMESGDFQKAWGGIASLQLGLSIIWTEAQKRGFSFTDIAHWMSARPAEFVGLAGKKGAIASGYDADFVLWDPDRRFEVTQSMIHHRHKMTPYEGQTLSGRIERTYLRGKKIFENGTFPQQPFGQILTRNDDATHT